jgi:hypothetical protein
MQKNGFRDESAKGTDKILTAKVEVEQTLHLGSPTCRLSLAEASELLNWRLPGANVTREPSWYDEQ